MTETRALLLTDVVDSTKLSEALGDEGMAERWAAHDRVARDLLPPRGGREIDKTDGFLLLFDDPAEAVAYALAYHAALEPLGLQARAGLHVGPVVLRENPVSDVARGAKPLEVDGLAKPTAARVMALALPGQTLLTADAAKALAGRVSPGELVAHGHWMLKGVLAPVPLFEVGEPGRAPLTPPPDGTKAWRVVWRNGAWTPVREVRHTLPRERDAFVGREADLRELARRLDDGAALVSVLGIGGTGKTRLVTHYGWTFLGSWPGGVWFCDLSEARGVDGILHAVANGLEVPLGAADPVAQLGHAVAGRGRCLVVLDNFEQVTRYAPDTLEPWLDRAPEAQFVVTTREVLGLPGEVALALAPLAARDAVALFEERARLAKRDFVVTDAERPAVEALVKLLDALPLALELAAARVRVMPPSVLLQRMSERFRLLASSGGRHTRQATLRGALDWSWELLSPDEQLGLAQLSVFEGGFGLEAAEAVLALGEAWPTDVVQALVDKSLVRPQGDGRFDLLVSVQEYAAEKLAASGGHDEAVARHGAYFTAFGTREAASARSRHGGVALRRALAADLDNLVAACSRAVTRGDGAVAVGALVAAWSVLELRGPLQAGLALGRAVAGVPGLDTTDRARVSFVVGQAVALIGRSDEALTWLEEAARVEGPDQAEHLATVGRLLDDLARHDEAAATCTRALALARAAGDRRAAGVALGHLGVALLRDHGQPGPARAALEEALVLHREVGNRLQEGAVLANLALLDQIGERFERATERYHAALAVHREVGNRRFEATVLNNLATTWRSMGQASLSLTCAGDALAIARDTGDRRNESLALLNLGHAARVHGRLEEARAHLRAAWAVARELGEDHLEGAVSEVLGTLARASGDPDEALAHQQAQVALFRRTGDRRGLAVGLVHLADVLCDLDRFAEARVCADEALELSLAVSSGVIEGATRSTLGRIALGEGALDEARAHFDAGEAMLRTAGALEDVGLLLCRRAELSAHVGDRDAARRAWSEAASIAEQLGMGQATELGLELARTAASLEELAG